MEGDFALMTPLRTPSSRFRTVPDRTQNCALRPFASITLLAAAVSVTLAGCASSSTGGSGSSGTGATGRAVNYSGSAVSDLDDRNAAALAEVERQYLLGPTAARELGYRIDWQYRGNLVGAKIFDVQHDSVFLLDSRNLLTRLDRTDGRRIWSLPVAEQILDIKGINYVPEDERVYLTAGGSLLVLDAANGSQVGRQNLGRVANTPSVRFGQFLIYGSRSGQMIWHSFPIAFQWRGYQVSQSMQVPPVLHGDYLVAAGNDGRVIVLDAPTATMHWDKRLLAPVVAKPAVGESAVFVAGVDQHVWAYDLSTGRNIWRYLTESPLYTSPAVVGKHVYQQVPEVGLVCFVARPVDRPGGEIVWIAPDIDGEVIGGRGGRLFVWSQASGRLSIVDERSGGLVSELRLRDVREIRVVGRDAEEIYAYGEGGRVTRLRAR